MNDSKTPTPRSDVTLTALPPVPVPVVPISPPQVAYTLRDVVREVLGNGPAWARILVAVLLTLAGAIGHKCTESKPAPAPAPNVNVQPTPVNVTVQPPAVSYASHPDVKVVSSEEFLRQWRGDGSKLTPRQRIFTERMRHRLAERLQKDGYALAGGDATPLTKEEADRAVGKLTEGQVFGAAYSAGAWGQIGDDGGGGGLLGFIQRIVTWFAEHPEVVQAILRILMSLLMFI